MCLFVSDFKIRRGRGGNMKAANGFHILAQADSFFRVMKGRGNLVNRNRSSKKAVGAFEKFYLRSHFVKVSRRLIVHFVFLFQGRKNFIMIITQETFTVFDGSFTLLGVNIGVGSMLFKNLKNLFCRTFRQGSNI